MKRMRGFTLLEILIALIILALGLAAASRVGGNATDHAAALRDRQLASWVAENRAAWLHASREWPAPGNSTGSSRMAGRDFRWEQQTTAVAQDRFRRIEVHVRAAEAPDGAALARFVAYLEHP